jgi:hypothetical protein
VEKDKNAETLAENFINVTSDIKSILKILYIEILKLSKFRERKTSLIKRASFFIIVAVLAGNPPRNESFLKVENSHII